MTAPVPALHLITVPQAVGPVAQDQTRAGCTRWAPNTLVPLWEYWSSDMCASAA